MPTDAWPYDEAHMLPPLVLRPPHGPRLVRLLVVILAVILYLPPAGWSPITNGAEGELAAAALDLLNHGGVCVPATTPLVHGPLVPWLTSVSFALFGVNECAARVPAVLGVLIAVWMVLRLAELFGTVMQGFVAALILLCAPGMFTLGRLLTPVPLTAALLAGSIYCLQCGVECHRTRRRSWLVMAWFNWALATLAGGWAAGAIPAATVLLLLLFYRQARLRFRSLLSWQGLMTFALTLVVMTATGFPPGGGSGDASALVIAPVQLLGWQIGLLFPWSLLLLPALGDVLLKCLTRRPLEWNEALPLAWLAAGFAVAITDPVLFSPLLFWPAFAVWGAGRLMIMHRRIFWWGCGVIALAACYGLYATQHLRGVLPWLFPAKAQAFTAIPDFFWSAVTPVAFTAMLAFLMFVGAAFWAEFSQNRRFALLALIAAMIPAGFAFADIGAKFATYFSDAGMANTIDSKREAEVIFLDASRFDTSSLRFYLGDEARDALRPWGSAAEVKTAWNPPVLLVTNRSRLPFWQKTLKGRLSVLCDSGEHLLLTAQP